MESELKADIKCPKCKTYRYEKNFLNDKNRRLKTCQSCRQISTKSRNKNKCEHNRRRSYCIECGGSQICEHNRQRNSCKDCGGNQICKHNRQQSQCKDCGGGSICVHNRRRSYCKDCGGNSICEHKRERDKCKECGGSSICEHNRVRNTCKDCGGSSICEHNRHRNTCKECNDPIKLTIKQMIRCSKHTDKKHNRYDADHFIDRCFLEGLVEEYPNCYYEDCKVELQYIKYQDDLSTIERLDNKIGHIKSNCVICCLKCNNMKKSNNTSKN